MGCAVEGCIRPVNCRGWCHTHYERFRRSGVLGVPGDARRTTPTTCSVEGCDRRAKARGWCDKHYLRWKSHGDPTFLKRPTYGTGRRLSDDGYVMVWEPSHPLAVAPGYVFEHRKVVYDAGIVIPAGWHVHHKNGVKDDNRLENLQVISGSEHARRHVHEDGYVTNQFGTYKVGTGGTYGKPHAYSATECEGCGRLIGVRANGRRYEHRCEAKKDAA